MVICSQFACLCLLMNNSVLYSETSHTGGYMHAEQSHWSNWKQAFKHCKAGVSKLLASLGHTGRRVVLGHTLNTQTLMKTDEQKKRFQVNLRFCVGPHSWPSWAVCGLQSRGWAPLVEHYVTMKYYRIVKTNELYLYALTLINLTSITMTEDARRGRTLKRFQSWINTSCI